MGIEERMTCGLFVGDCLELFPEIENGQIDLIATDPPFNIGYSKYDVYDDSASKEYYLEWSQAWINQCVRVLRPSGSMFVAIGDERAAEIKILLDRTGMTMRNWIIWHYSFGAACTDKFSRSHAHILYYVKDPKNFTFNADAVRVPSARQIQYNDKRANPKGKVPDDTWVFHPESDTWKFSRVCGTFKERTGHPCQMNQKVLDRIILACSNPGELVLDPFSGSGTTLAAAKALGRRYLGFELSEAYAVEARARLEATERRN